MDPAQTPSRQMFKNIYEQFSLGMVRWCYGISEHLETVILDQPISYIDAAVLIQSCPNLKNLQIGYDQTTFKCFDGDGPFSLDVVLPKLESYCSRMYDPKGELDLNVKILLSCESLLYFGAPLMISQDQTIDVLNHMKLAFGKLVALDLVKCAFGVLEILADVDHLQLRYFGFGELLPILSLDDIDEIVELRGLLKRILPKLKTLELLKIGGPGIGSSTIKLLTKLKLNLKFVVFQESIGHNRCYTDDNPDESDYFTAEVLADFGQMLLSNDPGLDLSEFYFFVDEKEVAQDLKEVNFGFTFVSSYDDYEMDCCDVRLNFQSIKRRLGIDF